MSRVTPSSALTNVLKFFLVSLCLVMSGLAASQADAGEAARKHHRQYAGVKHQQHDYKPIWRKRGHQDAHKASGVLLASGRRSGDVKNEHRRTAQSHASFVRNSNRHHGEYRYARRHDSHSGHALVIYVNQGSVDRAGIDAAGGLIPMPKGTDSQGAMLEGGCASGAYCSIRLGPYSNSPKIITVNSSLISVPGATGDGQRAMPGAEPEAAETVLLEDEELLRRYGDK